MTNIPFAQCDEERLRNRYKISKTTNLLYNKKNGSDAW